MTVGSTRTSQGIVHESDECSRDPNGSTVGERGDSQPQSDTILTMDRSLTAVPICEDAGWKPPQHRQLWSQSQRRCDDPAGGPTRGRCRCSVEAVKRECPAPRHSAGRHDDAHSRLTAGHRCAICTTVASAIQSASIPGEEVSSPGPLLLWSDGRIVTPSGQSQVEVSDESLERGHVECLALRHSHLGQGPRTCGPLQLQDAADNDATAGADDGAFADVDSYKAARVVKGADIHARELIAWIR
jgi:hypothetical protein